MGVRKYGLVAASDVKIRDPSDPANQTNMSASSHMMANARNRPIMSPSPHLVRPGAEWARAGKLGGKLGGLMIQRTQRAVKQRQARIAGEHGEAMGQHPAAQNLYSSPIFGPGAASTVGTRESYYQAPSQMGARQSLPDTAETPAVQTINPIMPEDTFHSYEAPKGMGTGPASRRAKFAQGRGMP